jgi:hypothetical protein
MALFLRVIAVAGRLVPNPATLGTGDLRMVGHDKFFDGVTFTYPRGKGPDLPNGGAVPKREWKFSPEPVVVGEIDGYLRNRIQDGDLEYVASIDAADISAALNAPASAWRVDSTLADATKRLKAKSAPTESTALVAQEV